MRGSLRGRAFEVRDARFTIDRRPGNEHADLLLSDATAEEPCGELSPRDPARIWLRRAGSAFPAAEGARIHPTDGPSTSDAGAWEVHYEMLEDGRWTGTGSAAAWLQLTQAEGGLDVSGALSVCFADGRSSCATGRFVARYCPSELDRPLRGVTPPESPSSRPVAPPPEPAVEQGS